MQNLENIGSTGGVIPFENIPASQESSTIGGVTKDQIKRSEEEGAMLALSSMFPQLITPNADGNPTMSVTALATLNQQCTQYILDRWTQDVQQNAEASNEKARSDQVLQTQMNQQRINDLVNLLTPQALSMTLDPNQNPIIPQDTVGASNAINPTTGRETNVGQLAFQTSLLVSMALSMGASASIIAANDPGAVSGITSSLFQATPVASVDTSGAASLIASLFGPSIYYGAMKELIGTMNTNANPQALPAQFAEKLSQKTLAFVNNPAFSNFVLSTLPGGTAQAATLSQADVTKILSMAKMSYLLSALAVAYQAEAGGGTPSEVWAMATGKMNLNANDPRLALIGALQQALAAFSPDEQKAIQDRFNSIQFKSLMDPVKLLQEMASSRSFRSKQLENETV